MHSAIVRHVLWPLHDAMLRRPTFAEARRLEDSQWLSPAELHGLQAGKLRDLLVHAGSKTPFYRERLARAAVRPRTMEPFEALRRLPAISKNEIRGNVGRMIWSDAPGGLFAGSTGGSTGEPLQFYFDRRRQACDQAGRIRSHRWFGVQAGERELYLWGSPLETRGTDRLRRIRDGLFNHRLLDAFQMSPERMDAYLAEWSRFRPRSVFAYPSSLVLLAEHAAARGRMIPTDDLRAVFVTGEKCYPHQRETLERALGVPVADGYGSREAGFIAHQCPRGRMHIAAEHVVVEILNGDQPAAAGQAGEIVVTHLEAWAMPFIRYRTGDVGRLLSGRCECGRGLPLMDVVEGRATDFLRLPDGTIKHALSVIYPLRALPGVRQFRVIQRADFGISVEVCPVPHESAPPAEIVASAVRRAVGGDVPISVEWLPEIPVAPSGKYRYVESHAGRESPGAARPAEAVTHAG